MTEHTAKPFPAEACLPQLKDVLANGNQAVLVAPPGAGKTTRVPLALSDTSWCKGKVIVLEPRRLAARAAANFVAGELGEKPGGMVGYRVRLDSRVSDRTRVAFVTEGVFARMIGADPELSAVSAVIFDEFHERNLDGDLGLALALDCQAGLRPDLRLLVMSATIEGRQVSHFLGNAPIVESEGRSFPVDIRYEMPPAQEPISRSVARSVRNAIAAGNGSILCFLPGQREIERVAALLRDTLPSEIELHELFGAMEPGRQDAAIRPAPPRKRKIVLATSVAETSITIDGITVVIDSGLRRAPKFEPDTGLTRLETIKAARSTVDQRAGRAGRTAPGIAIRLWAESQTAALAANETPEIENADLTGLVLSLADWGVTDPRELRWMTPPPVPAWREAVAQLAGLGALDGSGAITATGRKLKAMPLAPRLANMVIKAAEFRQAEEAARLAILLSERGLGGRSIDLAERLERLANERSRRADASRTMAQRLCKDMRKGAREPVSAGALLSLAFPERIARSRGSRGRFQMANGRGAIVDEAERLAHAPALVVADLQGAAVGAKILAAAEIDEAEIETLHGERIETVRDLEFNEASGQFRAIVRRRLGSLILSQSIARIGPKDETEKALCKLVREKGLDILPWEKRSLQLRQRLAFLHGQQPDRWPFMDDRHLVDSLEEWLLPFVENPRGPADITAAMLIEGLHHLAAAEGCNMREADRLAPATYTSPAGVSHPIEYRMDGPLVSLRVQEIYGLARQPAVMNGNVPVTLELLSPAMRPIQLTRDLAGFWEGSWQDVRRDMRGRYPKHAWPADPASATPTVKTKRAR